MIVFAPLSGDVAGVILAGGLGRRLGGAKALRMLAGRPLLAHVIDRLAPQVAPGRLMLNVNEQALGIASFGLSIVADTKLLNR